MSALQDKKRSNAHEPPSKRPADDPICGFDNAAGTVRVHHHDLARLVLEFRSLFGREAPGSWQHMSDYDRPSSG